MAKAKFPGKPSKSSPITRLRFSCRNVNFSSDSSRLTAKELASGLLLFNETFGLTDEDEDLHGFEKIGDSFIACYAQKTIKQSAKDDVFDEIPHWKYRQKNVITVRENSANVARTETCSPASENPQVLQSLKNDEFKTKVKKTEWMLKNGKMMRTGVIPHSIHNGNGGNETRLAKKLLDKAKSPKKFVLPSISAHSSRPIIPNKRFLEDMVSVRKRKCRELHGLLTKSQFRKMQKASHTSGTEETDCIGKERMKREIERYADIMTTEVADQKQKRDEHKKKQSLRDDKEGKLREKIQQLLRSQWESRLQLVDGKSDLPAKKQMIEVQDTASSSEEDRIFCKTRRLGCAHGSSSNSIKSKTILRKARLQLNQKLLKQLRQPARLQQFQEQLVSPKKEPVVLLKRKETSKSALLRPPQLLLLNPNTSLRTPSPTTSSLKEMPDALPLPNPTALNCRLSSFQPVGNTGVSNPLGCAFVMEPNDTKGLPGTVVCGVCGAVRRYSFILQARKFGTFSCEPCRKFISRVLRARVPVKCSSGTGRCIHPPVLRWNNACPPEDKPPGGEVMTTRCKACWLKLALTGFRMRECDHDDLRRLLPADMQDLVPTAANRLENLPWAPNRGQIIRMKSNSETKVPQSPSSSLTVTAAEAVMQQELRIENQDLSSSVKSNDSADKSSKAEHCAGSRTRKKSGGSQDQSITSRRSSLEIKGPRVKNVCRSANLALGQPRAKFINEETNCPQHAKNSDGTCACCLSSDSSSPVPATSECSPRHLTKHTNRKATSLNNPSKSQSLNRPLDRKNSLGSPARPATINQGERIPVSYLDTNLELRRLHSSVGFVTPAARAWQQQESNKAKNDNSSVTLMTVSTKAAGRKLNEVGDRLLVNVWERRNADRIRKQGFAVIGSKLPSCSLCYICGSAGRDELVYCSTCCNPFHPFCLGDGSRVAFHTKYLQPDCCHWKTENFNTITREESADLEKSCNSKWKSRNSEVTDRLPLKSTSEHSHSSQLTDPISSEKSPHVCHETVAHQALQISESSFCSEYVGIEKSVTRGLDHVSWGQERMSTWTCLNCSLFEICPVCLKQHNWKSGEEDRLHCTCCQAWIHASCEGLPKEEFIVFSAMTAVKYICRLCSPEQKWIGVLHQQLNSCYANVLKSLVEQKTLKPEDIDLATRDIVINELNCVAFCQLVRRLTNNSDIAERVLSAVLPLARSNNMKATVSSTVTRCKHRSKDNELAGNKAVYDLESDNRICTMCHGRGEGPASSEGRLLYCNNEQWVHVNCALWSRGVVEKVDGALQNLPHALSRSRNTRCTICQQIGASLCCSAQGCTKSFHFPCASKDPEVMKLVEKRVFCSDHSNFATTKKSEFQTNFKVSRCVYVDLEEERVGPIPLEEIGVIIGSLHITSLGHSRADVSAMETPPVPIGFKCHRRYWSVKEPWKLVTYRFRTVYESGIADCDETEKSATVSHDDDDDAIMAESGLNLAELDTQDDRELIHMVLEDANFEQELEGGSEAALNSSNDFRDSGFYSDSHSVEKASPSPTEDHAVSLEAWLADPEHAVILLDSALLASLEMDPQSSAVSLSVAEDRPSTSTSTIDHQPAELASAIRTLSTYKKGKSRLTYSQWRKMKIKTMKSKSGTSAAMAKTAISMEKMTSRPVESSGSHPLPNTNLTQSYSVSNSSGTQLDLNGNETDWNRGNSNLTASIKVSSLAGNASVIDSNHWRRSTCNQILQFDGAADSSENEVNEELSGKSCERNDDQPVKCRRCRRSYKTLQSFEKHKTMCVELLSSGGSSNGNSSCDGDSDVEEKMSAQFPRPPTPKPIEASDAVDSLKREFVPIQVPIVNSSSSVSKHSVAASSSNGQSVKSDKIRYCTKKCVKAAVPKRRISDMNRVSRRPIATRIASIQIRDSPSNLPLFTLAPSFTNCQSTQQPVLYVTNPLDVNRLVSPIVASQEVHQQVYIIPSSGYSLSPAPVNTATISTPSLLNGSLLMQPSFPLATSGPALQYFGAAPSNVISNLGLINASPFPTLFPEQSLFKWEPPISNQFICLQQPHLLLSSLPTLVSVSQPNLVSMEMTQQPAFVNAISSHPQNQIHAVEGNVLADTSSSAVTESSAKFTTSIGSPNSADALNPDQQKSTGTSNSAEPQEFTAGVDCHELQSDLSTTKENDMSLTDNLQSTTSAGDEKIPGATIGSDGCEEVSPTLDSFQLMPNFESLEQETSSVRPQVVASDCNRPITPAPLLDDKTSLTREASTSIGANDEVVETCVNSTVNPRNIFEELPNSPIPRIMPLPSPVPLHPMFTSITSTSGSEIKSSKACHHGDSLSSDGNIEESNQLTKKDKLFYELTSDDGYYAKSESLSKIWMQLLEVLQDARLSHKMKPLASLHFFKQWNLIGLNHSAVRYLLEQLPSANRRSSYTFKHHAPQVEPENDLSVPSFGCARMTPYHGRTRYDTFNWLASQYRIQPQSPQTCLIAEFDLMQPVGVRRATSSELQPLSVRYKNLSRTVRQSVGVYRSNIHGRGLFSKRDIEAGEMVVEYAGEVIRSVLCDKREKDYEAKGIGCYMFRIDDSTIVDATMHGNCARFINHSCEPNCYSRIVDISGKKHIIIFALRRILRGEELTYDYKFPIEDIKIPCTCGSRNCRKYLN